jgi:hypothetical protein
LTDPPPDEPEPELEPLLPQPAAALSNIAAAVPPAMMRIIRFMQSSP